MRRGGALLLVLICVSLGGCLSGDAVRPSTWLDRLRSPRSALGSDGVLIDLVLIERPLGDPFLNDEVWKSTDRHVVGMERASILENNGFRVGQVVGMNPAELQKLLDQDRYWSSHRRQILAAGSTTAMGLGPTQPQFNFRLKTGQGDADVLLDQGQSVLKIEPFLEKEGRTRLKFTPQVLYGAQMPDYQASKAGWLLEFKRQSKVYPELSWEVTLAPNQFLIVGSRFEDSDEDAPQSLGGQCFIQENGRTFVQRMLVIRTARGSDDDYGRREPGPAGPDSSEVDTGFPPTHPPVPSTPAGQCLQCSSF